MKGLLAVAGAHKVAATVVAAAVVVAGGGVVHAAMSAGTTATVVRVVDGDTIDVRYDGDTHRVRLLNIDTPETVDPEKPVQCLGPEASDYVKERLPVGSEVRLEHDAEVQDGYGRELAAVFTGDDLVAADIARQGLGVAMSVAPNTRFLAPVQQAQVEARQAGRGMYSAAVGCTIPAQVAQLEQAAAVVVSEQQSTTAALAAFDAHAADLAAVLAAAATVRGVLQGDVGAFPLLPYLDGELTYLRDRVSSVSTDVQRAADDNSAARAAEQKRLDDAAAAQAAAEEAARKAAEDAARKAAEDAARQAAAEEEARQAAERAAAAAAARQPSGSTGSSSRGSSASAGSSSATRTAAPTSASSGSGSGSGGYTGCRSYAPGGKTYTPIPCPGS